MIRHKWAESLPAMDQWKLGTYKTVAAALDTLYPGISLDQLKELLQWGVRAAMNSNGQTRGMRVKAKAKKHYVELSLAVSHVRQRVAKPEWVKPVITCGLAKTIVNAATGADTAGRDWNWDLAIRGVQV